MCACACVCVLLEKSTFQEIFTVSYNLRRSCVSIFPPIHTHVLMSILNSHKARARHACNRWFIYCPLCHFPRVGIKFCANDIITFIAFALSPHLFIITHCTKYAYIPFTYTLTHRIMSHKGNAYFRFEITTQKKHSEIKQKRGRRKRPAGIVRLTRIAYGRHTLPLVFGNCTHFLQL